MDTMPNTSMTLLTLTSVRRTLNYPEAFTGHMSLWARKLLDEVLATLDRQLGPHKLKALQLFAANFKTSDYENASLSFMAKDLVPAITAQLTQARIEKALKAGKETDLVKVLTLKLNDAPTRKEHAFVIAPQDEEAFAYLTQRFLMADFAEHELIKLSEIVKLCTADELRAYCSRLDKPEQRNASYLYKVITSDQQAEAARRAAMAKRIDDSAREIAAMTAWQREPKVKVEQRDENWLPVVEAQSKLLDGDLDATQTLDFSKMTDEQITAVMVAAEKGSTKFG